MRNMLTVLTVAAVGAAIVTIVALSSPDGARGGAVPPKIEIDVAIQVQENGDPSGHACCIGMPSNITLSVETTVSPNAIGFTIDGPFPWVGVFGIALGDPATGLQLEGTGSGTVASYPNITVEFTGTFFPGEPILTGTYTMGAMGGLPGGMPITYELKPKPGTPAPPTPTELPSGPTATGIPTATPEGKCPQPKEKGDEIVWELYPGGSTYFSNVFGMATVTSSARMVIVPDADGLCIVSHEEDPGVETFGGYGAVVSEKKEIENLPSGVHCVKWSIRVHMRGILGTMTGQPGTEGFDINVKLGGIGPSGTLLLVVRFCADGTGAVLEDRLLARADRLGSATPLGVATPGPAVGLVQSGAELLVAESGCPVTFQGVTAKEKVVDPAQVIDDIVATTVAPVGSNFVCTDVVTLTEALDQGLVTTSLVNEYRSFLSTVVAEGDQLVTVNWLRGDGLEFSTIAVTNAAGDEFKWDSMISLWALPGPPLPAPAPPIVVGPDSDLDGDGCTDLQEFGDDENLGGRRNPLDFWDFFDPNRDGAVGLLDFLAVLRHFGTVGDPSTLDPDGPEPPIGEYWALADRGGQAPDGDPWDELPANGSIGLTDFLSVLRQFGHTCL